jgi:hypothetical protein
LNELWRLEDQLLEIEARVGLLEACRPLGIAAEERRLEAALFRGARSEELVPHVDFPRRPALDAEEARLSQVRRACERLAEASGDTGEVARILGERAAEIALDIELVRARGTPQLVLHAKRRFAGAASAERADADALAREWLNSARAADASDHTLEVDLGLEMRRLIADAGLDIDVLEVEMVARAAVTERAVLVRRHERLGRPHVARIFAHEVHGHLLPRRAAARVGPPFRIGPQGADADEEGRALHLEQTGALMDASREFELAVRHTLAAHVLDGGHIGEALVSLHQDGAPRGVLARSAARVFRAGGLCREIIYLPGLLRMGRALRDPDIELVFRCGRATLVEAPFLRRLLAQAQPYQVKSATTGV